MLKKRILSIVLALTMLMVPGAYAAQPAKDDMRGVWVASVHNIDFPSEQGMTAEETAAMRESMEIQAITFAPQLLEALHAIHGDGALSAEPGACSGAGSVELQIVFQINGSASPETVEALREYGDEFAERVLEVMEEAGIDTARRAYK